MSVSLVVFTDGRDHIYETIPSALACLRGPVTRRLIYDDSDNAENRARLAEAFPTFTIAYSAEGRQGFGGAIRFMWRYLARHDENEWIFHLEDDFRFGREVDLLAMIAVMNLRLNLVQMALRRQPWNAEEREAGGVVELKPYQYTDMHDGAHDWLEHNQFFTTNPCLYRRSLCEMGWPEDPHSEGKFGAELRDRLQYPTTFGFWGARDSGEWVEHVGRDRVGTGY